MASGYSGAVRDIPKWFRNSLMLRYIPKRHFYIENGFGYKLSILHRKAASEYRKEAFYIPKRLFKTFNFHQTDIIHANKGFTTEITSLHPNATLDAIAIDNER